ncbi:MAG: hypothetical protein AAFV80_03375, partial [Bacteroidota bacterium]
GSILDNTEASYWHHSLSGYLAAKLQLYQELVETYFADGNPATMKPVLDMLNTKYILSPRQDGSIGAQRTGTNLGNAWFVNGVDLVANADAELLALASTDLKNVAVVQQKHADYLAGLEFVPDSLVNPNNEIALTYYHPDTMRYQYSADREQLAVFSEMYYPASKGWKILIDGQQLADDFIKADFALRAARVPAGQHELTMIFAPRSYYSGIKFSYLGSLLGILLFFGSFGFKFYKNDWSNSSAVAEFYDPEEEKPAPKTPPVKTKSKKTKSGKPVKKKRK